MLKQAILNEPAPDFSYLNHIGEKQEFGELKNKWIILYFYPKDNTSGCTLEAVDFTCRVNQFIEQDAIILGVSPDSQKSHENFINKHNLVIELISDPNHSILEAYGCWGKMKLYGKEYFGVIRSTFIINPNRVIAAEWRNVKVKNHVQEVYNKLLELKTTENDPKRKD